MYCTMPKILKIICILLFNFYLFSVYNFIFITGQKLNENIYKVLQDFVRIKYWNFHQFLPRIYLHYYS